MSTPIPPSAVADDALRLLSARLDDLCARASRGAPAMTPFLTPREAAFAARQLAARLSAGTALLWGGYPAAERVRAILLPDYIEGLVDPAALTPDPLAALDAAGLSELSELVREAACSLSVRGSGYRVLSHRDYLGSTLGLGVERDAVGDIVCLGEHEALLMTDARMADFLASDLKRVATDAVRVSRVADGAALIPARRLAPIHDTVASARLDCVVASLCSLSREGAQTAIRQGLCELDYEPVTAPDRPVAPPATISVRGYGKFLVEDFDGETRKGRMRLKAGKYI